MATIVENHVPKWFNVQSVPQSHVFPVGDRPRDEPVRLCKNIPIIDLDATNSVQEIIKAGKDFGFFQVIDHGVPEDVTDGALKVLKELFSMPSEELSKGADEGGYVYMSSTSYASNGAHLWRDNIKHPCHPLEDCMRHWPHKPTRYREVMRPYVEGDEGLH